MKTALSYCLTGLCLLLLTTPVTAAEDGLDPAARLDIEVSWLEGNLERMDAYEGRVATAQDLLCFAIRDRYWRPDPARATALEARLQALPTPVPESLLAGAPDAATGDGLHASRLSLVRGGRANAACSRTSGRDGRHRRRSRSDSEL